MRAVIRLSVGVLLAAGCLGGLGCGRDDAQPNPGLKVPDVPPGGRDHKPPGKGPVKKP